MAIALTSRRTTIAAVTSAVAAAALAAAVAGRSCTVSTPGPDAVVHDLLAAAKAQDRHAVFELLSPNTRKHIEERAKHATDLVGSSTRFTAIDLLSIGIAEPGSSPTDITTIEQLGDHAVVEVVSPEGRARLSVIEVEGRWLIDLPGYGEL
jgi:hypothetical protein